MSVPFFFFCLEFLNRANHFALTFIRSHHHFYAISTWLDLSSRSSVRVITGIINYICPLVSSTPTSTSRTSLLPPSALVRTVDESMEKYRIRCSSLDGVVSTQGPGARNKRRRGEPKARRRAHRSARACVARKKISQLLIARSSHWFAAKEDPGAFLVGEKAAA